MNQWLQLTYETPLGSLSALEEALEDIGVQAITLEDNKNQPIFEPEPGTMPLWEKVQVKALFQLASINEAEYTGLKLDNEIRTYNSLNALPQPIVEVIKDEAWERRCMDDFQPMCFGERLWIIPSWSEKPADTKVSISLDPGLAFGTGSHPTTWLCLNWLDKHINAAAPIKVIDFGCGSGILALSALALGAEFAWAIDLDPQALTACKENAEKNSLSNQLTYLLPETINNNERNRVPKADLVIANILAKPLISLASTFASLALPNANLVLSGILENQSDSVIQAYSPWFNDFDIKTKEGWALLTASRKSN